MSILQAGRKLELEDGRVITVGPCIGRGGEGEVYKVTLNDTGEEKALKWYNSEVSLQVKRNKYSNFTTNIAVGNPHKSFLWPQALAKWVEDENGEVSFGYIMDLLPSEFILFNRVISGNKEVHLDTLIDVCINLVSSFRALHLRGYSYQDVNPKNFALDPESGEILVFDTDNIVANGQFGGVRGFPGYMAPEIVDGSKKWPDVNTDLYSLAVIIFHMLVGNHPLEGARVGSILNDEEIKKSFGRDPLFIFDKYDKSNANDDEYAEYVWSMLPKFAKDCFCEAFDKNACLVSDRGRLIHDVWLYMLLRLKGFLVHCPFCGSYLFLDGQSEVGCKNCKKRTKPQYILDIRGAFCGSLKLPAVNEVVLYKNLLFITDNYDEGILAVEKDSSGKLYLKNISDASWQIEALHDTYEVESGERCPLQDGLMVRFGHGRKAVAEVNL